MEVLVEVVERRATLRLDPAAVRNHIGRVPAMFFLDVELDGVPASGLPAVLWPRRGEFVLSVPSLFEHHDVIALQLELERSPRPLLSCSTGQAAPPAKRRCCREAGELARQQIGGELR